MAVKFYTEAFMARRREWWKRNIWAAECQIAAEPGVWKRGVIQYREVEAEKSAVVVKATFDQFFSQSVDYVAVRLLDIAGNVAAVKPCHEHSGALNNVRFTFTLPIVEKCDKSGTAFRALLDVDSETNTATASVADLDTTTLEVYDENYRVLTVGTDYTADYTDGTHTITMLYEGYSAVYVFCKKVVEEEE